MSSIDGGRMIQSGDQKSTRPRGRATNSPLGGISLGLAISLNSALGGLILIPATVAGSIYSRSASGPGGGASEFLAKLARTSAGGGGTSGLTGRVEPGV